MYRCSYQFVSITDTNVFSIVSFPYIVVRLSNLELRVICWLFAIKNRNDFVLFERLLFAQSKVRCYCFLPYPIIAVHSQITCPQCCGKRLTPKQADRSIAFNNSIILSPQWFKRYHAIPLASRCSI